MDGDELPSEPSGRIDDPERGVGSEPDILGWVDRVDRFGVVGWATTPGDPSHTVKVSVLLNGAVVGSARCDELRPDVLGAGRHPTGVCGFSFEWPSALKRGEIHQVEVRIQGGEHNRFFTQIRL